MLKGRQVVFLFLENFKTFDNSEIVFGFDHLSSISLDGEDLHGFLTKWNNILENMCGGLLSDAALRDVFYRKLRHCPSLSIDINKYERFKEGDADKSYAFLLDCVKSVIKLKRQQKNIVEKESILGHRAKAKAASVVEETALSAITPKSKHDAKVADDAAKKADAKSLKTTEALEKAKEKIATMTTALAAAKAGSWSSTPKAKAKGEGKGSEGKGKGKSKIACYYFHHETCSRGDSCMFSHAPVSEDFRKAMLNPWLHLVPLPLLAVLPVTKKSHLAKRKERDAVIATLGYQLASVNVNLVPSPISIRKRSISYWLPLLHNK